MSSIKQILFNTNSPLSPDICENLVKFEGKKHELKILSASHEFVIGSDTGNAEVIKTYKIPLPNKPYILLGYAVKPLLNSLKFDAGEDNRFWLFAPTSKQLKEFGGSDGHQITPNRGRFFTLHTSEIYKGELSVRFKVHPSNLDLLKRARLRLMLNLGFLYDI